MNIFNTKSKNQKLPNYFVSFFVTISFQILNLCTNPTFFLFYRKQNVYS